MSAWKIRPMNSALAESSRLQRQAGSQRTKSADISFGTHPGFQALSRALREFLAHFAVKTSCAKGQIESWTIILLNRHEKWNGLAGLQLKFSALVSIGNEDVLTRFANAHDQDAI